tara:strand:+ start:964 stop:1251 length:288 start_codon:yes stop_codon:yes gene_type:complete
MGVVVSKRPYKSIPTDTPDKYSSINMNDYSYNDGMPLVHENGVHRQHFCRVLTSAPARGIVATGDAQQVPTSTRRAPKRYNNFVEKERGQADSIA